VEKKDDFYLSEEAADWLALKKSEFLSELIGVLPPDDLGFEKFHEFDDLIPSTIEQPDRSYMSKNDDFPLQVFVRSYPYRSEVVHHVILGALIPDQQRQDVFVPVLIFATLKNSVAGHFLKGEKQKGPTLN
jgi:chromosome condensin MukBEF complex kleisin-like MukF subunit